LVKPSLMLKAVCEALIKAYSNNMRKGTNLVIKQLEIHDTEGRVRVLPYITAKENGNSGLDRLDNSGLQILYLGIHV
jgi:hypothetical protein